MFKEAFKTYGKPLALLKIVGLIGLVLVINTLTYHFSYRVATVNITGLVKSFVNETARLHLAPEVAHQQVERFGKVLDKALQTMSQKKHLILLPQEAVIAGANDVTEDVQRIIKQALKL